MPGSYAHITAVHIARSNVRDSNLHSSTLFAIGTWLGAVVLGAVSPDYPYLVLHKKRAQRWADLMHYTRTAVMLANGVRHLRNLKGSELELATAWFFGFASHVAMDTTIHPVIERIVGPWKYNKAAHRKCEMHQDVYIFERLGGADAGYSDHFNVAIDTCTDSVAGGLNKAISSLWIKMLHSTHPKEFITSPPNPDEWHKCFSRALRAVSGANNMARCSRHVGVNASIVYPHDASAEYLLDLPTPEGEMTYDDIFDRAVSNVVALWSILDNAIHGEEDGLKGMRNWNLDTGMISGTKQFVFWSPS